MKYVTKAFQSYENVRMDEWLNDRANEGYVVVEFKSVGSNSVLFVMVKQ